MTRQRRSLEGGFTLIEILVVISIIMILAGLTLSALVSVNQSAKERAARADLQRILQSIEQYKVFYFFYPFDGSLGYTSVTEMTAADILRMLKYDETNNPLPRGTLLEVKASRLDAAGYMLDPWKHRYHIFIDEDAEDNGPGKPPGDGEWDVRMKVDGTTPLPLAEVRSAVEVYSMGDDGETDFGHNSRDAHPRIDHESIADISEPFDDVTPEK